MDNANEIVKVCKVHSELKLSEVDIKKIKYYYCKYCRKISDKKRAKKLSSAYVKKILSFEFETKYITDEMVAEKRNKILINRLRKSYIDNNNEKKVEEDTILKICNLHGNLTKKDLKLGYTNSGKKFSICRACARIRTRNYQKTKKGKITQLKSQNKMTENLTDYYIRWQLRKRGFKIENISKELIECYRKIIEIKRLNRSKKYDNQC